jgi:hypothetical protein
MGTQPDEADGRFTSSQQPADGKYGSKADLAAGQGHVRIALESGRNHPSEPLSFVHIVLSARIAPNHPPKNHHLERAIG